MMPQPPFSLFNSVYGFDPFTAMDGPLLRITPELIQQARMLVEDTSFLNNLTLALNVISPQSWPYIMDVFQSSVDRVQVQVMYMNTPGSANFSGIPAKFADMDLGMRTFAQYLNLNLTGTWVSGRTDRPRELRYEWSAMEGIAGDYVDMLKMQGTHLPFPVANMSTAWSSEIPPCITRKGDKNMGEIHDGEVLQFPMDGFPTTAGKKCVYYIHVNSGKGTSQFFAAHGPNFLAPSAGAVSAIWTASGDLPTSTWHSGGGSVTYGFPGWVSWTSTRGMSPWAPLDTYVAVILGMPASTDSPVLFSYGTVGSFKLNPGMPMSWMQRSSHPKFAVFSVEGPSNATLQTMKITSNLGTIQVGRGATVAAAFNSTSWMNMSMAGRWNSESGALFQDTFDTMPIVIVFDTSFHYNQTIERQRFLTPNNTRMPFPLFPGWPMGYRDGTPYDTLLASQEPLYWAQQYFNRELGPPAATWNIEVEVMPLASSAKSSPANTGAMMNMQQQQGPPGLCGGQSRWLDPWQQQQGQQQGAK